MARSRTSENYLREESKPEPLGSPQGPNPPSSGSDLTFGGRLDTRAMLVTNKVTDSLARRSRKDPRKNTLEAVGKESVHMPGVAVVHGALQEQRCWAECLGSRGDP